MKLSDACREMLVAAIYDDSNLPDQIDQQIVQLRQTYAMTRKMISSQVAEQFRCVPADHCECSMYDRWGNLTVCIFCEARAFQARMPRPDYLAITRDVSA